MKIVYLATAASLVAGSAFAGGFVAPVVEQPVVAPVVTPVAADTDWTGFYAGAQLGMLNATASAPGEADVDGDGTTYGLHAGYLHDFGKAVVGGELAYNKVRDFQFDGEDVKAKGDQTSLKLLAGYDAGRILPYATAGYSKLSLTPDGEDKTTGDGYLVGVGAKFLATDNIMVGAELAKHMYKDFNDVDGADLDTTTFGVNVSYKF